MKCFRRANKRGFTLMEMVATVAIIAVLVAVAIPLSAQLRLDLEMMELDTAARQIFLSAQNELTTIKSTGVLGSMQRELETNALDTVYRLDALGDLGRPQDYGEPDDKWKSLYYFPSDSTATAELVNSYLVRNNSVLLAYLSGDDNFVIELDPASGDVYGVFYAEHGFSYITDVTALASRSRSDRSALRLGYYGGSVATSAISQLPDAFAPVLTVVNKEELYLHAECPDLTSLILRNRELLKLTLTVKDESGAEWVQEYTGYDMDVSSGSARMDVLLDSMSYGKSFASITGLTAGDNLSITAEFSFAKDGSTAVGRAFATANSLFAAKDADGALSVAYVRHLNNLRAAVFPDAAARTVTQTRDIDFDDATWESDAVLSGAAENPLAAFAPVDYVELFDNGAYLGNNKELRNFVISGADNVGLFARLRNAEVRDVIMVDPVVSGSGDNVGALAGSLTSCQVSGCGVYVTSRNEWGVYVGKSAMADAMAKYTVSGGSYVGGLIGRAAGNSEISCCYAALNVSGGSYVGGLAGAFEGAALSNSYSSGDVTATSYAGGLAGGLSGAISGCYSTSDTTATSYAGSFVGYLSSAAVTSCRSYGQLTASGGNRGAFVGSRADSTLSGCVCMYQAGYNEYSTAAGGVSYTNYSGLSTVGDSDNEGYSFGYDARLADKQFPFALARTADETKITHYGDWPLGVQVQSSVVYYEKYRDGSYGFYALTSLEGEDAGANAWLLDTLKNEACVEDGYAILTTYALSKMEYTLNDASSGTLLLNATPNQGYNNYFNRIATDLSLTFTTGTESFTTSGNNLYRLPFALQMTERLAAKRFYDKLSVNGFDETGNQVFADYLFYYCPDFAKTAHNPSLGGSQTGAAPANPETVSVRSPRQLNCLSRAPYFWGSSENNSFSSTFVQETDLNYGIYTKNYCGHAVYDLMDTSRDNPYRNRPIGRAGGQLFTINGVTYQWSRFQNSYDGQNKLIIDYCCTCYAEDTYQFAGLFGQVNMNTLRNIHLVASDPENTSGYVRNTYNANKNSATGALAGAMWMNSADQIPAPSLINCSVSGYEVTHTVSSGYSNRVYVGGLVGWSHGPVENCSAVNKLVQANITAGNSTLYLGGLIGGFWGDGHIYNSYAGGTLSVLSSTPSYLGGLCGGVISPGNGFGGNIANRKIINCYAFTAWDRDKLQANTNIAGFLAVGWGNCSTISNCYYLNDTAVIGNGVILNDTQAAAQTYEQLRGQSFAAYGNAFASGTAAASYPWSGSLSGAAYPFPALVSSGGGYAHWGDWPLPGAPVVSENPTGTIGAAILFSTGYLGGGGWVSTGYFLNGSLVDLDQTPPAESTTDRGTALYRYDTVVLLFSNDIDPDDWSVSYTTSNGISADLYPATLSDSATYTQDGYNAYTFDIGTGGGGTRVYRVYLTHTPSGNEYVFSRTFINRAYGMDYTGFTAGE